jgi:hypothetical protein
VTHASLREARYPWDPRGDSPPEASLNEAVAPYPADDARLAARGEASPGGFEPGNDHFGKPAKAWTFSWIAEEFQVIEAGSSVSLVSLDSPPIARVRGAGVETGDA